MWSERWTKCSKDLEQQRVEKTSHLILEVPDSIAVSKLIVRRTTLGQNATLEATHVEEQVGIVFAVDRHETVLPQRRRHRARQTILYVPEHGPATTPPCKPITLNNSDQLLNDVLNKSFISELSNVTIFSATQ